MILKSALLSVHILNAWLDPHSLDCRWYELLSSSTTFEPESVCAHEIPLLLVTITVAVALYEPPDPEQVREYVVVEVGFTDWLPLVAVELPQDGWQALAFVELQLMIEACPEAIEVGLALRLTVGAEVLSAVLVVDDGEAVFALLLAPFFALDDEGVEDFAG